MTLYKFSLFCTCSMSPLCLHVLNAILSDTNSCCVRTGRIDVLRTTLRRIAWLRHRSQQPALLCTSSVRNSDDVSAVLP